ncbi:MAG: hypothetical protein VXZ72_01990, partial [Chlamydiota bacterium]|nr:hypothetical protein [Chlamydiota bacterium]
MSTPTIFPESNIRPSSYEKPPETCQVACIGLLLISTLSTTLCVAFLIEKGVKVKVALPIGAA